MKQPITLNITGMHCASCETLITEELKETAGVSDISVSSKEGKAKLMFDTALSPINALLEAVDRAGYKASIESTLSSKENSGSQPVILKNQSSRKPMKVQFESRLKAEGKILEDQNARRFKVPLDRFPKILAAEATCNALPAFDKARPENQPDAE